ncbi:MAG: helix-turn-helix domain-containing protein [Candidatus Marinimicrobia bacterium]|nr:helix-turn-helix domain-containing protein [Candidatus Neomarinimicrobiota bacterium]
MQNIVTYCQTNQLTERPKQKTGQVSASISKKIGKARHQIVGEKFNDGSSILDLTREFQVKVNTIVDHLYNFSSEGNVLLFKQNFLEISQLSSEEQLAAHKAFEQHGTTALRPIYDALHEKVSYEELKIIRLYLLLQQ